MRTLEEKAAYNKAWLRADRAAHPEKWKAMRRAEYLRHQERYRLYNANPAAPSASRRQEHPELYLARDADTRNRKRQLELERHRRYGIEWRSRNPDYFRQHYRKHRSEVLARNQQWAVANRDRLAIIKARHKQRLRETPHHLTYEDWLEVLRLYRNACAYCGRDDVRLTRDHARPLSRGGDDVIANIVPACGSCNSKKSTRTLLEYTAQMAVS